MKKKLHFITGNSTKFRELSSIIPEIEQVDIDLPEIQELDPQKIIEAKLQVALDQGFDPLIVEDTSLYIDSMNGMPGPLIKWFLKALGTQGIAALASSKGPSAARAKTVIGFAQKGKSHQYFEGVVEGQIVSPRGVEFGWNSIFKPHNSKCTFGEMDAAEFQMHSMRFIAAEKLKQALPTE